MLTHGGTLARGEPQGVDPLGQRAGRIAHFLERRQRAGRRTRRPHGQRPADHGERGGDGCQRHQDEEDPLTEWERHIEAQSRA